jgi:putative ABC transport system substrate-binding protein
MNSKRHFKNRVRKVWLILAGVIILSLLLGGCAQKPKVYQVGLMSSNASFQAMIDGFKAKMAELGYVEGQNINYVVETAQATPDDRIRAAKKLVEEKVDLIFVSGSLDAVAAQAATQGSNVPVVFTYGQTEGTNLVKSVREPGGNMTGVRYPGPEMISRRLEVLLKMAPQIKRVWIGYNKSGPNAATTLAALRPAASSLGVTLVEVPAAKMDDIKADLDARTKVADLGMDAIMTMPDEFNTSAANFEVLSKFAAAHHLPVAGGLDSQAQQGAIFINGTDFKSVGALAAPLADKVLKGTAAGTIPVVTPEQTLVINYKVAQGLGLTVPEGLLKQATQIIR